MGTERRRVCGGWTLVLLFMAPAAAAQSRADEIAAAQAEKAQRLQPYVPSRVEQILSNVEGGLVAPRPISVTFDSVYSGGGLTLGGRFLRFYGDRSTWTLRGLYSIQHYKLVEINTISSGHSQGRIDLAARAGWRDATEVAYYGLGMGTSPDARTSFRFQQTYGEGSVTVRPLPWLPLGGRLSYEVFQQMSGRGSAPSIESAHTPVTAPGIGEDMSFVHAAVHGGIDTRRPAAMYTRKGGYYGLSYDRYGDVDGTYTFDRAEATLIHHVPVLRDTWVLALRARVQTTLGDDVVPFHLLPSLGSGSTLRAFPSWRFRDRHSLLTTIEWRWIPNRQAFDMAIFYDAGKVTARRADLSLRHLATDWGVGGRFHLPRVTLLRIELARGSEQWNLVFASSAIF